MLPNLKKWEDFRAYNTCRLWLATFKIFCLPIQENHKMYTFRAKSIQFNVWFLRRMFFPLCWRGCHLYHVWEIHLKLYYSMDFSVWNSKQNYEKDQFFEWLYQCFIRLRKYFLLRITFPRLVYVSFLYWQAWGRVLGSCLFKISAKLPILNVYHTSPVFLSMPLLN